VAAAVAISLLIRIELRVGGEFRVLPTTNADVRPEVDGILAEVYVREGMPVQERDVVARLADRDVAAELRKTQAGIAEKQATVRMLQMGLAREKTAVAKAEDRLRYKTSNYDRMKLLHQSDFISLKDLEQAEEEAVVKEKELHEARLLTGSRREQIEAQEAEIARLEAQRLHLEEQRRLTNIRTGITGIVTTPERQLRELVGQHVKKGDLIASVHRLDTVTAEIKLSERDVGDVSVGQPVAVKARAFPNTTFRGTVTSVGAAVRTPPPTTPVVKSGSPLAAMPEEPSGDRIVLVTTEIENPSRILKPEMTGRAKISAGERSLFGVLTRRLARVVRVEFWSWW
jgi:HlyD family secretion protein